MKKLLFLGLGVLLTSLSSFAQTPENTTETTTHESTASTPKKLWHRARIYYQSNEMLALLSAQGVPLDHGKKKSGVYIESDFSDNEIGIARMLGCEVEILIEDVSQYYKDQNLKENQSATNVQKNATCSGGGSGTPTYTTPTHWEQGSMGGYYTYTEMLAELDEMASLYPNLITVKAPISTFQTYEGRSIYWVKISDNPNTDETEPEILYDAIHHAREPMAMQQLIYYMWYLLENYATDSEIQSIVDNTELYFIPVLNPDGYEYNCTQDPNGGGMWRKNRYNGHGVDNNRNYDYIDGGGSSVWGTSGVSFNTSNDTYPGTGPFTEVENQAMKWFCENHDFRMALNNHSYDNSLLYPYGYDYNKLTPENATYEAISSMMVQYHGEGMVAKLSSELYPAAGDSDDWGYGADLATKPRIFSFTPEIGTTGFWPASNQIESVCNSMMWTNITAAHLITNYSKTADASPYSVAVTSGYFKYTIQRLGLEDPANFTVSINPLSSNITSVGGSNTHSSMTMLQTDTDSISFTLSSSIAAGDDISYEILIDNGYFVESIVVNKIYGEGTPILTDLADNLSNWTVSQTWNTTSSDYYSASSSITDSPTGDYSNNINKTITLTNNVDLSIAISAIASFYAKWELEDNYDYVQFEVSTDNGSTWTPQCGQYTNLGSSDQDQGNPLYDGFQTTWVKEEVNLSDYLGQNVKMRFQIISDGGVREDGFYFDDFEVSIVTPSSNDIEESENGYVLSGYPNPTRDLFNVSYVIPGGASEGTLTVTNKLGQTVATYALGSSKGTTQINTASFADGMYFFSVSNGTSHSSVQKMMVVK